MELKTKNFTIQIFDYGTRGYFEHNDLGDEWGGGLWFEGKELRDYDGVFALPKEVATCLRENGFIVPSPCVDGEDE